MLEFMNLISTCVTNISFIIETPLLVAYLHKWNANMMTSLASSLQAIHFCGCPAGFCMNILHMWQANLKFDYIDTYVY